MAFDATGKSYFPIVFQDNNAFIITNHGTAAAPCRLTITPQFDVMQMEITGLSDEPIVMTRVMKNSVVVIDGIDRKVTIDGEDKFDLYEGWEFPKLKPGDNEVKITNGDTSTIYIEYQPRYI